MTWLIEVNRRTCICVGAARGYFNVVDGVSCPSRPETEPADVLLDAAESCPVEAITIRDVQTGQVLAPEE